jgi:hypothetical protein
MLCASKWAKIGFLLFSMLSLSSEAQRRRFMVYGLHPVPQELTAGLNGVVADSLYYKEPLEPHPQLYRKESARSFVRIPLGSLSFRADATAHEKRCWYVFVSGGLDCSRLVPQSINLQEDILEKARQISRAQGLLRAREYVEEAMLQRDASRGQFEASVIRATKEKNWMIEDSVLKLEPEKIARIGVFVIFGIDLTGNSPNRELIRRAHAELLKMGFAAHLVNTKPAVDYQSNAVIIGKEFEERVASLDHVIFVAVSKGVADLLTYMMKEGALLSMEQRQKVRAVVSLSGVVRGSNVAEALMDSEDVLLQLSRVFIGSKPVKPLEGIRALAQDPWSGKNPSLLKKNYPNLKWISFSMLPDGPDALVHSGILLMELQQSVIRTGKHFSPSDGLVESAATILPPGTGIKEWIIRGYGPHALALGTFMDGTPIAPQNRRGEDVNPEAGAEILSSFMRALSQDFISAD